MHNIKTILFFYKITSTISMQKQKNKAQKDIFHLWHTRCKTTYRKLY